MSSSRARVPSWHDASEMAEVTDPCHATADTEFCLVTLESLEQGVPLGYSGRSARIGAQLIRVIVDS